MSQPQTDPAQLKALLSWYLEAGVDEVVSDAPEDWFALHARAPAPEPAGRAAPERRAPPPRPAVPPSAQPANPRPLTRPAAPAVASDKEAMESAVALAAKAQSVADLRVALSDFNGCALKKTATNLCFTDGNEAARVLCVGEAPGAEEDRQGLPFVGPSGKLLDLMLASVGLDRHGDGDHAALISNTVFWRPPGNRTPTPAETAICLPFVERLIEIVQPRVLVCVGGPSAKALLGQAQGITRLRGKWFDYATPRMAAPIPAMALYHPAYLLRTPAAKRDAWRDLLMLKAKLTKS